MTIRIGSIRASACPGSKISARIEEDAKATPDPNPPFEMPAKITAGIATAKNIRFNSNMARPRKRLVSQAL